MLFIVRPPQRPSDRLRTSLTVTRSIADLAGAGGAGGVCTTAGGGDSERDAIWGAGGLGRGVNGTGARPVSRISGALDFTAGDRLAAWRGTISGVDVDRGLKAGDGGLKIAALAVPATTKKARASATRFMERPL